MQLHAYLTPQEWKDLLNLLVAHGALLTNYAETDGNGLFVDFKYATVEYNGEFFYIQGDSNIFNPFTVTRYSKISPFVKHQNAYPKEISDTDQLFAYMNESHVKRPFKDAHDQRVFLGTNLYVLRDHKTDLWRLEHELAGNREREILNNLAYITTIQHTADYYVLRFHTDDGKHFDYETKSRRIVG